MKGHCSGEGGGSLPVLGDEGHGENTSNTA